MNSGSQLSRMLYQSYLVSGSQLSRLLSSDAGTLGWSDPVSHDCGSFVECGPTIMPHSHAKSIFRLHVISSVHTHTQFWNLVFNTDVCFLIIRTYSFGITPWIRSRSRWYYRLVLLLSNFVTNTRGQLWMKVNHVQSVVTVLRNRSEGSDAAENLGQLVRDPQVRSPWVSIQYRLMTWARG